jgi:hypothetical protein
MQQGDEVDGQVTLDLCGGDFPSEALRVARHQVAFPIGDDFDRAVSNEVVAYERDGADQAMRELRRAVDRCPDRFVGSAVATKPVARYHIKQLPPHGSWQTGSLALHIRVEARAGDSPSYEYIAVYQVRGQLLSALYLSGRRAEAQLDDLSALVSHRLDDIVVSSSA